MDVWTEVMNENLAVTHVEGHHVFVPLGDVKPETVRRAKDELRWRQQLEYTRDELQELRKEFDRQKALDQALARAGVNLRP